MIFVKNLMQTIMKGLTEHTYNVGGHTVSYTYMHCISDSSLEYIMINSSAKAGRFYLLPKLHKKGCPASRQVISGYNTSTEKNLEFIDYHLTPLVTAIPSYTVIL